MLSRLSLLVLAALLTVCCLGLAQPSSARATVLMTEDTNLFGKGPNSMAQAGYAISGYAGAKMVRLNVGFDSNFSWANADYFVATSRAHGFDPYLTLTRRPATWDEGSSTYLANYTTGQFAAHCQQAAQRYGTQVLHYGVWNEPNHNEIGNLPAAQYNSYYQACRTAIKQVVPSAKVYWGELASGTCAYFDNALGTSGITTTDGVALHTYQWTVPPEQPVEGTSTCRGIGSLPTWRGLLNLNTHRIRNPSGGPADIVITEHGYCRQGATCDGSTANSIPEAQRADWARRSFDWAEEYGVKIFNYYHVGMFANPAGKWDTGMMQPDGSGSTLAAGLRTAVGLGKPTRSDVDGDGLADLTTLMSTGTAYVIPIGSYTGAFTNGVPSFNGSMQPALFSGNGHYVVDVSDVTGDRRSDLVTLFSSGTAYVYPGQANRTFSPSGTPSFSGTMQPGILSSPGHEPVGVADVTGDGRGDLVTHYKNSGTPANDTIFVYPGQANGVFGGGISSFGGSMDSALFDSNGHYLLDVADVTGDGRADLVTHFTPFSAAMVYPGQANGTFGGGVTSFTGSLEMSMIDGTGHEPIGVADVTGDGRADLVSHYQKPGTALHQNIYVYPGQGNGTFGEGIASFAGSMDSALFDGTGHELATLIDVHGDGKADLVSVHNNGNGYVFMGRANGTFGEAKASFNGGFSSRRFNPSYGHEIATEKPARRRRGCAANGCH